MKIAIPILFFSKPGGYRVLSMLASQWVSMGHSVTFFCTAHSNVPYFPTTADIIWLDEKGYAVESNINDEFCKVGGIKNVLKNLLLLLKGINRYASDYDILLANQNLTAWPVLFSSTNAKKFYYVQAYEPEFYELRNDKRALLLRYISAITYILPLARIVNSPIYFKYKWLKAKKFIPPGIDFSIFYPIRSEKRNWSEKNVILGCIGRKEIEKGTSYVFDAFELLIEQGINVELHVAFGNLTVEQSCHPKCKIIIPQNDVELGNYYRSLDIMIAPGLIQLGAPHYPVMEAMACGIPVITTGYMPATDENAWIVPVKDSLAIASAAISIIENIENTDEKVVKGLAAISVYSWQHVSSKMLSLFEG